MKAAAPEDRDKFIKAAEVRDAEQLWTNELPHAKNPSERINHERARRAKSLRSER